jgi:drug/metabolite transporter (DMT)-like permease
MAKLLTILLVGLLFEAIGVVFLSRGLKEIGELGEISLRGVLQLAGHGVANPHILLGVFFEALFFVALLILISKADVSFVWPLTSLSFVITTIAAKVYLHEHVSSLRWSGVCLIMLGAGLITWTEKSKEAASSATSPVSSQSANSLPTD